MVSSNYAECISIWFPNSQLTRLDQSPQLVNWKMQGFALWFGKSHLIDVKLKARKIIIMKFKILKNQENNGGFITEFLKSVLSGTRQSNSIVVSKIIFYLFHSL